MFVISSPVTLAQVAALDLLDLSLEELLQIEISVSSVSRRSQTLLETSAAVYVITASDIKHSPANNLPDLLRTVPGLEVAQLDANKWAISARGFNSRLSSKMLLIIDGRTVYASTYGTVLWEAQGVALNDIEQIEVIRGPGANIWGANAVNGVVSITTKSPESTPGNTLSLSGGSHIRYDNSYRMSGSSGENSHYKVYGSIKEIDSFQDTQGRDAIDNWDYQQIGLQFNSMLSNADKITFQSEIFDQTIQQQSDSIQTLESLQLNVHEQINQKGVSLLTRWEHLSNSGSSYTTQFYYDARERDALLTKDKLSTYDLDFIYRNSTASRHNITIGAGARQVQHDSTPTAYLRFVSEDKELNVYNMSIHDDYSFQDDTILSLGIKMEHNVFTGTEYMGSLRLNQTLSDKQTFWASVSRTVRTPTRGESDSIIAVDKYDAFSQQGLYFDLYLQKELSPDFHSEYQNSFEAGWRFNNTKGLKLDISTFYNQYTDLRGAEAGLPYCFPNPLCNMPIDYVIQPLYVNNNSQANAYGIEALFKWRLSESLTIESSYSYFDIDFSSNMGTADLDLISGLLNEGTTPHRDNPLEKMIAQANWQLSNTMNLNLLYRYVSKPGFSDIPSYSVFDVKYNWQINRNTHFFLSARNLGEGAHEEFREAVVKSRTALVEKSIHAGFSWEW